MALEINPNNAQAYVNVGNILVKKNRNSEAVAYFNKAMRITNLPMAHYKLANVYHRLGRLDKTVVHLTELVRLNQGTVDVLNDLAWLLAAYNKAEFHDPTEAIRLAERACEISKYGNPKTLDTLSVAYASAGRFNDAIAIAKKGLVLAEARNRKDLIEKIKNRLNLYKINQSYTASLPKTLSE